MLHRVSTRCQSSFSLVQTRPHHFLSFWFERGEFLKQLRHSRYGCIGFDRRLSVPDLVACSMKCGTSISIPNVSDGWTYQWSWIIFNPIVLATRIRLKNESVWSLKASNCINSNCTLNNNKHSLRVLPFRHCPHWWCKHLSLCVHSCPSKHLKKKETRAGWL